MKKLIVTVQEKHFSKDAVIGVEEYECAAEIAESQPSTTTNSTMNAIALWQQACECDYKLKAYYRKSSIFSEFIARYKDHF
jgi:hypothetical protein